MIKLILFFLIFTPVLTKADGGSVDNGGDGIFCTWRRPYALDYYATGFIGGILYGQFSNIIDIYKTNVSVTTTVIEFLKQELDHPGIWHNGVNPEHIRKLIKQITKASELYADYTVWQKADEIPEIKDSLDEDFLPQGCIKKQVVQFRDGLIRVNRSAFDQLDQKQKEVLALHESLYWLGRKHYGHKNSFLTRSLIRAIFRRGSKTKKIPRVSEFHDEIDAFIKNRLPNDANAISEDIAGSAKLNTWRLNIFDLDGEYTLAASSQKNAWCPKNIDIKVDDTLEFKITSKTDGTFKKLDSDQIEHLGQLVGEMTHLIQPTDYSFLNIENNDRLLATQFFEYMLGLNRKDQFYLFDSRKSGSKNISSKTCFYDRSFK